MRYICSMIFDTRNLGALNADKASLLIKYACDRGISFFDISPHFMKGKSERVFLEALSLIEEKVSISYKFGRIPQPCDTKEAFLKKLHFDLERFGVDAFEVYTIYDINSFETWQEHRELGGIYEAAMEAKRRGLIKRLAVTSTLYEAELKCIFDMCPDIDCVFTPISPLNKAERKGVADLCDKRGKALFASAPLLGGVFEKYPHTIAQISEQGLSGVQSALKFVADLNVSLMCAFTSKSQIDEALYALSDEAPVLDMSAKLGAYETFCTGCGLCGAVCPIKSSVPKLMDAYNAYIALRNVNDMVSAAISIFGQDDYLYQTRKCIGCLLCERICPQGIKISERIERLRNEAHKT